MDWRKAIRLSTDEAATEGSWRTVKAVRILRFKPFITALGKLTGNLKL